MSFLNKNKNVFISILVLVLFVAVGEFAIASLPKRVNMLIDGDSKIIETSAKTVEDLIIEQGYELSDIELLDAKLDKPVRDKLEINFNTRKNITFKNQGQELYISTFKNYVKELLEENEIKADEDDVVSPALDTKLKNNSQVTYNNVVVENYKTVEPIPFVKIEKYDFNIDFGSNKVSVNGANGEKELSHRKVTINGKVVIDEINSEEVIKRPVNEVILIGSKEIVEDALAFNVVEKEDDSMYVGESETIQDGKDGLIRYTYKNEGKNRILVKEEVLKKSTDKIINIGTKRKASVASSSLYSLRDLQFHGVINWDGKKFTYYSQSVLPGGGLRIPGRHVNEAGFVADGDGYIVLANDDPKGTIISTPFGYMGKVYDRGTYGNHYDVYTK